MAKRIATKPKKVDYNYEIVNTSTGKIHGKAPGEILDKMYAQTEQEAEKLYSAWLKERGWPNDTQDIGYRQIEKNSGSKAVGDDYASDWEAVYVPTGHVFDTLAHADAEQARTWAQSMGDAVRPEDIQVRRVGHQQAADARRDSVDLQRRLGVRDVDIDVTQNFDPSAYERNNLS